MAQGLTQQERQELERLRAENAKLREEMESGVAVRASERGAIGLRLPGSKRWITLYRDEWEGVYAQRERVEEFIKKSGNMPTRAQARKENGSGRRKKKEA